LKPTVVFDVVNPMPKAIPNIVINGWKKSFHYFLDIQPIHEPFLGLACRTSPLIPFMSMNISSVTSLRANCMFFLFFCHNYMGMAETGVYPQL
jgi:hypothetical protein